MRRAFPALAALDYNPRSIIFSGKRMRQMKASDFDQALLNHFDEYVHGITDRRQFLERAKAFATAGVSAAMLLEMLSPRFAQAQQVAKDDKRLKSEYLEYDSPKGYGKVRGYFSRPAAASGNLPAILLVGENRGLNPHIEDMVRRTALENFVVFAPDPLSTFGGYPGDEDKAAAAFRTLDFAKVREDYLAAVGVLRARPEVTGKMGVLGFCFGGGVSNFIATRIPELSAVVTYYGAAPKAEDVAGIKAKLLLHYAEKDERINAGWPAYETALKANGVSYTDFLYPGVQHAFNNDTTPRYDEAAAKLAWSRTVEFFNKHLRG